MKKIGDYVYPSIEITTVVGCRVNCKYCPQNVFLKAYYSENSSRENKMSFDTFKTCIDKMPPNSTIIFSGAAEPMLNESVYDMILYANETKGRIRLLTTLEGMTVEGFQRIKDIPFEAVVLHAPDSEGYANIQMDEKYFKLLDMIVSQNKSDGSPFIDYCNCQGTFHPDFLAHITRELNGINKKTLLHNRAGNIENDGTLCTRRIHGPMFCGGSFPVLNHFMLMPDGTVCLCCMDFGMKHVLGNLLDMNYKEIRKSKELKEIEHAMRWDDSKNILCRNCSYGRKIGDLIRR